MEQPVTIKYRWTAEELIRAHGYHFRHSCRPVFRFGLHFIFALMLLAGVFVLAKDGIKRGLVPVAFVVVGTYWFTLRSFERRWLLRRQFAKRPDKDTEIEWQITPDKVFIKSGLGSGECEWRAFAKMVRAPDGLMFYPNEQIFHWLPRSAFASAGDFDKVIELAKSKVQRTYEVS